MSTNPVQNTDNQEIDLSKIGQGFSQFIESVVISLFKGIIFLKKNILAIIILFILGAAIGYYLDKNTKIYNHKVIVIPNFGSSDYLYSKIELLNSKVKEKDTVFLKNIGIKNVKNFLKIEIEPVIDAYNFINRKEENFLLLKLLAEDSNIEKVIADKTTSKNYLYHEIGIITKGETELDFIIKPILDFFNDSEYFSKIKKEAINNLNEKIKSNENIITQIDGVLHEFSNTVSGSSPKSDKLIYYNENTQLNDVIKTKDEMVRELGNLRVSLVNQEQIVKETSISLNIKKTDSLNGKMKLVLPLLFISLFILLKLFIKLYRKQIQKISVE